MGMLRFDEAAQWVLVIVLLLLLLAIVHRSIYRIAANYNERVEGFRSGGADAVYSRAPVEDVSPSEYAQYTSVTKTVPSKIYDKFYAQMYERIVNDYKRNLMEYEIDEMERHTRLREYGQRAAVLDLGCGCGWHVRKLAKRRYSCVGMDQSRSMLDKAREYVGKQRNVRLVQGDMTERSTFHPGEFTHITCFYFTLYYAPDPSVVFRNVHTWLKRDGYFCVHVVDPKRFDPVLDAANPLVGISRQNYMRVRQTESKVYLKNCVYHSRFELNRRENSARFVETFVYPERRSVRYHHHKLSMPPLRAVVRMSRDAGFRMRRVLHLVHLGYEYQYLCVLQKV